MLAPFVSFGATQPMNDWIASIQKVKSSSLSLDVQLIVQAFEDLTTSISRLPQYLAADDLSTLRHFTRGKLQHIVKDLDAYFDRIDGATFQDDFELLFVSQASNEVLQNSEDDSAKAACIAPLDFQSKPIEACGDVGEHTNELHGDLTLISASESHGKEAKSSISLPECFESDKGICPRDLELVSSRCSTLSTPHTKVTAFMTETSSDPQTGCLDQMLYGFGNDASKDRGASLALGAQPLTSGVEDSFSAFCEGWHVAQTYHDDPDKQQDNDVTCNDDQATDPGSREQCETSWRQHFQDSDSLGECRSTEVLHLLDAAKTNPESTSDDHLENQTMTDDTHMRSDELTDDVLQRRSEDLFTSQTEQAPGQVQSCQPSELEIRAPQKSVKLRKSRRKQHPRKSTPKTQLPEWKIQKPLAAAWTQDSDIFGTFLKELGHGEFEQASFLTRLYYAIASPDAFLQLQEALKMARAFTASNAFVGGSSVSATVQALDTLDSNCYLSHILRRYYLVRLLKFRIERENAHKTSRQQLRPKRVLKYDTSRIECLSRQRESNAEVPRRSERGSDVFLGRADSQAIRDIYDLVYPNEKGCEDGQGQDRALQKKRVDKLRTRLACARTWFKLVDRFSIGVLALIPCGGNHKISIDQVERLPTRILSMFLAHLKQGRGEFVASVSEQLSPHVFEILSRQSSDTLQFALETIDELALSQACPDSHEIQILCRAIA